MYIITSIFGIQHTCINFLIITKIECWPVFKQDPMLLSECSVCGGSAAVSPFNIDPCCLITAVFTVAWHAVPGRWEVAFALPGKMS